MVEISTDKKTFLEKYLSTPFATIFASILTTFFAAALLFKISGPVPIQVKQTSVDKENTFQVTETAEVSTTPDQARVSLGMTIDRATVSQAQDELNQTINNITNELKNLGVKEENIKTRNYNIRPKYDYSRDTRTVTGYTASSNLQITLSDFEKMNNTIDTATSLGANQVGGISFLLSEEKKEELRKDLRKQAIDKAKDKANELAKLSGLKLGNVINVKENLDTPNYFLQRELMAPAGAGEMDREPTDIQPGSTDYSITITLSYETF